LNITVFGGSSLKPGDPAYKEAFQLGSLLGRSGHTVLTGGYIGTMEAVSKGAKEAGAHVIGVTCREIERWRPIKVNHYVMEEWACETLSERISKLIDHCDAAIALPGGVGTLAEISVMWNRLIIKDLPLKPLIVVGEAWHAVLTSFMEKQGFYLPMHDRHFVTFAASVQEAVNHINNHSKS
jgi:uncharacterized protein (TIGR00730 family)